MKLSKNKMVQSFVIQLISLVTIELIFRLISNYSILNYSFLRVVIFSIILATIISYLTSFLKPKAMLSINLIIVFICSIYSFIQIGYVNYMGAFMSTSASSQLGAVTTYIPEFMKSLKPIYYCLFIPFIIITISIIIIYKIVANKKAVFKVKKRYTHENKIMLLSSMISVLSFSMLYANFLDDKYMQDEQAFSLLSLFKTGNQPGIFIKEFGILPYSIIDIKNKLSPTEINTLENIEYTAVAANETRKFDDDNWKDIIAKEQNPTLNSLNNYFINNTITSTNEKTGIFSGKNVIVIMLESVNDIIDNPKYFPNFANLKNNGWYFPNHYSPRSNCPTGNNEFSSLTGLYANPNECTANINYQNTYFESLFNIFNKEDYYTNSFHNYNTKYYNRDLYHPNMGSSYYHDAAEMGLEIDEYAYEWTSDVDMIKYYLTTLDNEVPKNKKFMSYIITVSSHSSYQQPSKYGDMYLDMTEDTEYSMEIRRYLSKLKVVDNALGELVNGLKKRDLLDDTVIVLYGDHYPYSLTDDQLKEVLDRDLEDYERERTPFLIYNSKLKAEEFESYTSYLNLTPTLANLFGIEFDPRLYVGEDYFSKEYSGIVAFADLSWKNADIYYNSSTGKTKYYSKNLYSPEQIKKINQTIYNKNNASLLAIRYNYFAYLEEKLKDYEKEVN